MISKDIIKENGVIYTPSWIVKLILDFSNFTINIYNKKVIEPACGDGAFLQEIVERIIIDAQKHNIDNNLIKKLINDNVYGMDIDADAIKVAKLKLNDICKNYQINPPEWSNIIVVNTLSETIIKLYLNKFDFVFGNPPYVRIQNLDKETRKLIDANFDLCKHGSTDLYIAFFELGFKLLNNNGILGYITPNTFLTSVAGSDLREYLSYQNKVEILVDFEQHQVFNDATTYSLITIFNKNISNKNVKLYKGNSNSTKYDSRLDITQFGPSNWILEKKSFLKKINDIKTRGKPLGKISQIHTGIATLSDKLFIFKTPIFNGDIATISLKDGRIFNIEKNLLKKIIKASTWQNSNDDQGLFIIFPYKNLNNKNVIIPENELEKDYPLTIKYFISVKNELLKRDKGKPNPVSWYAFGRSQGINTAFGKKIITPAMSLNPKFIVCNDPNTLYYSGYSIVYKGDLDKLANQLNSADMKLFIEYTSRDYSGGYKSYAKSFIKDFGIII